MFQPSAGFVKHLFQGLFEFSFQGTFPDVENAPSLLAKGIIRLAIAGAVALDFLLPAINVGTGKAETGTVFMSVPEATLNENDSTVLGQNQIRFPRQIFVVEPKAETKPMKPLSDPQLRLSGT
jgi:hypothetical protein